MDFQNFIVRSVRITEFKKIKDLIIQPKEGENVFFGSFRSGKTSVCEFMQFVLYGADSVALARHNAENATGSVEILADGVPYRIHRSVIAGAETLKFTCGEKEVAVETAMTPGEYLTGLDRESFDLITYFRQSRYTDTLFRPKEEFLSKIAAFSPKTENVYQRVLAAEEKVSSLCNSTGGGLLDRLEAECKAVKNQLDARALFEEEVRSTEAALEEIRIKTDENERRSVLLKADMAGHTDDMILSRNKENAEELKIKIQADEKKLRLMNYDVTHKVGKLSERDLEELKSDYNRLSLAVTALSEARMSLTAAEENLSFHEKLFTGKETPEHYGAEGKKILKNKRLRMILQILGVLLIAGGASAAVILRSLSVRPMIQGIVLLSCVGLAVLLFLFSCVFTKRIRAILKENDQESIAAFREFSDRLQAHAKTTQVYRDQVKSEKAKCRRKSRDKDMVQQKIINRIQGLGFAEEDGDILAICDEIIEANDALADLGRTIEEEKEEYTKLLSADVEGPSLAVSAEFQAMQKELAFLTSQNDALFKKKVLLTSRLSAAKAELEKDPEILRKEEKRLEDEIRKNKEAFEAAVREQNLATAERASFEAELKTKMASDINETLSFMLKKGESFLFDESFELCFCDQNSVLPLMGAGGGMVSEMGLFAFRLSLAAQIHHLKLPMIFDDTLAMLSNEDAAALYEVIRKKCRQFFLTTSNPRVTEFVRDRECVIRL